MAKDFVAVKWVSDKKLAVATHAKPTPATTGTRDTSFKGEIRDWIKAAERRRVKSGDEDRTIWWNCRNDAESHCKSVDEHEHVSATRNISGSKTHRHGDELQWYITHDNIESKQCTKEHQNDDLTQSEGRQAILRSHHKPRSQTPAQRMQGGDNVWERESVQHDLVIDCKREVEEKPKDDPEDTRVEWSRISEENKGATATVRAMRRERSVLRKSICRRWRSEQGWNRVIWRKLGFRVSAFSVKGG